MDSIEQLKALEKHREAGGSAIVDAYQATQILRDAHTRLRQAVTAMADVAVDKCDEENKREVIALQRLVLASLDRIVAVLP